jgi:hypothetical protein
LEGKSVTNKPLDKLRHHASGTIERGEAQAITEQRATHTPGPWRSTTDGRIYSESATEWNRRAVLRADSCLMEG